MGCGNRATGEIYPRIPCLVRLAILTSDGEDIGSSRESPPGAPNSIEMILEIGDTVLAVIPQDELGPFDKLADPWPRK